MENLVVKEFDGIEYLRIKEVSIEEHTYLLFMDILTQSKVIICDRDLKEVKDKKTSIKILEKVFDKKSDIAYKDNEDNEEYYDEENCVPATILNDDELKEFFRQMKSEFFHRFGHNLLSEGKLDYKIKNGIESVETSPKPEGFKKNIER